MMTDVSTPIASPCIGICAVNADSICLGCYRSLAEIGAWLQLDDQARVDVLANCQDRKNRLD